MIDLWDIPAIDHHAHNLLTVEASQEFPYIAAFTEGNDPDILNDHARHSLFYRRSIRDIAQLLDCEPTETAILNSRQNLGLEKLTQHCIKAANLESLFLDDGFLSNQTLPQSWHQQFIPTQKILRLEELAENLLGETSKFDTFLDLFLKAIDPPPPEVIAFKSIAAYRTGLDIQITPKDFARSRFILLKKAAQNESSIRLVDKPLIDFLITEALEVAAKHKLPVQFHTGFGDPDLDLFVGNPVLLRPLLEEKRWRDAPIVLLHASYPYIREAGYLASVYPQVYLDFGLAVPFLSVMGMRSTLRQLLELSPTTKLMYSSDAHHIPELYYLGAKWGRKILKQVLEQSIQDGDLTVNEAEDIARGLLSENARRLYLNFQAQKLD
ncbi:amidohydrolase family protein [Capilliphycus salinus ALCB114379]|uniref:amidohydrolase family protein n=1 Tax=Capilliphycus salinus TaxID=2768948 RepID=UPI0039A7143F